MINPQIKKMHEKHHGASSALPKPINKMTSGGEADQEDRDGGAINEEHQVEVHNDHKGIRTVHHPSGEVKHHVDMASAHRAVDDHFASQGMPEQDQEHDMESSISGNAEY